MKTRAVLIGLVAASVLVVAGCGHSGTGSGGTSTHSGGGTTGTTNNTSTGAAGNTTGNVTTNTAGTTNSTGSTGSTNSTGTTNTSGNSTAPSTNSSSNNSTSTSSNSTGGVQAGVGLTASEQNAVSTAVQSYLSSPANAPVDCSALVQDALAKAGIKVPRTVDEQATTGAHLTSKSHLSYGDIVFFDLSSQPNKTTFDGIYVGNGQFVAQTGHGVETIQMNSSYWKDKFMFGIQPN